MASYTEENQVAAGKDRKKVTLEELETLYAQSKNARFKLESDWYMNLAFYGGDQWIFWNKDRIDRPRLEQWRVMFVDNRILPTVVARVAKKTKNRPSFICVPKTADDNDIANAEIGEKVLDNDWKALNLDYKHLLAHFWSEICGAGFWKIYWDRTKGEQAPFLVGPDGKPIKRQSGAGVRADSEEAAVIRQLYAEQGIELSEKMMGLGDLAIDVISPFELFPDPLATSLEECEWIIEEKIRSKEYIAKHYGKEFADKAREDAEVPVGIAESRMFSRDSDITSKEKAKGVRIFEYFCRPGTKHPEGRWCVWFNKTLVRDVSASESPYADFPYVMFTSNIVPGRFWPTSITTQLRGPQTDLNKLQSQIRENAIRIGNPPIGISREANMEPEWTGKPGEKYIYSDVLQNPLPVPIEMPEVPAYVREEVERIEHSIREISGIHEISQAKVPAGVTAASAINLLQEADDTRLGPEIQLMERTIATAGAYDLKLRAKFTAGSDILRIAGEDGGWDIVKWKSDMLKNIIDVDVQAGSGMPQSKAARQAAMQELLNLALQYGVPLNPRAMRKFFRDYELGGLDRLFQDLENDESQIIRENRMMYQGNAVMINDFDNDDLHIEGHEEEMKSAKWEQQPENIKALFLAHWREHKQRKVAAVNEQMRVIAEEQAQREELMNQQQMELESVKQQGKNSNTIE